MIKYAFSSGKKSLFWIRRKICTDQARFTSQNCSSQICGVRREQEIDVFTRVSVIIDDSYFSQKRWFIKLKIMMDLFLTNSFWLLKMLLDGLEWCGLLWCFISCLDSHYDGTHSLQSIHWGACNEMVHFSKSVLMEKQTHLHLGLNEGGEN